MPQSNFGFEVVRADKTYLKEATSMTSGPALRHIRVLQNFVLSVESCHDNCRLESLMSVKTQNVSQIVWASWSIIFQVVIKMAKKTVPSSPCQYSKS